MSFQLPPRPLTAEGKKRKVGFELEFAGIEIEEVAGIITSLFGGAVETEHRYLVHVRDTNVGDFSIELDARILQKMAKKDTLGVTIEEETLRKSIEEVLDKLAKTVVPLEIVMPPVEICKLHRFERLREALQKSQALGTKVSIVHAFGMHINIEAPDLKPKTLLDYLRAFLILYPWLLDQLQIDFSRRISPFVSHFPGPYIRRIMNPSYEPEVDLLIDDYLEYNPTRNRPLDMLPIFGMLKEEQIKLKLKGEKNRPRPTFHYRLPNSRVDDLNWRFGQEWKYWLRVETLVDDSEMLRKLSRLYLARDRDRIISFHREWAETVNILLELDEQ